VARRQETARPEVPRFAFAQLYRRSTGFKLFAILSLALLPLGMIAFFATIQSNRTADDESRAQLRIALNESSRKLLDTLAADIGVARIGLRAEREGPADSGRCTRIVQIFATQRGRAPRFALFGPGATPACATPGFAPVRDDVLTPGDHARFDIAGSNLVAVVPDPATGGAAVLQYSAPALFATAAPGGMVSGYSLSLLNDNETLPLVARAGRAGLAGYETLTSTIGTTGLEVEMTVARTPFSSAEFVAILLPLIMWAAAAVIGWLVVDRLLIRPLRRLELMVSGYRPGDILPPLAGSDSTAHELRQLSETFHTITLRVSTHENELAEGLARQTRLTREVHHRVKNNLQVVASLISLHARGQKSPEVIRAYASIQRRVDALAVVHRNHFAELEENRGIGLRSLIGELAQNIRGSIPEGEPAPPISIGIAPAYVSQDVAVPVAFLITELIELAMLVGPGTPIALRLGIADDMRARLQVESAALVDSPELTARMGDRFGRVLDGLSRQLRSPLLRSAKKGVFQIEFPILASDG